MLLLASPLEGGLLYEFKYREEFKERLHKKRKGNEEKREKEGWNVK